MKNIYRIKRNDVDAAIECFREGILRGTWDTDQGSTMLMMMDDPDELIRRIAEVAKEPHIAAILEAQRAAP